MASIDRTAYPRFKRSISVRELREAYSPSLDELEWARQMTDSDEALLSLTMCLKCCQRLALPIAHLMRLKAARAGLRTSVRELLSQLAAIEETVLIYSSTGGRPRVRRMTTELTSQQRELHEHFCLQRSAPRT